MSRYPGRSDGHQRRRVRGSRRVALAGVLILTLIGSAGTVLAASLPLASKALTVYRTCTLTATPSSSTVETDAFVNQSTPNGTNGTGTTMDSQSSNGANRRTYVRFDLTRCRPAIPAAASVNGALLRLYVTAIPAVCRTEDIFRVGASWTETVVTWNNQPFGSAVNNPASGLRTSFITVGAAPCQNTAAGTYVNGWNVAADVAAFVAGNATNFGWMVRDDVENSATARNARFSTREANLLAQSPQLLITYST